MSRCEMRYTVHGTSYPPPGVRQASRGYTSRFRTVFDDRFGGIRVESKVIDSPGMVVQGVNSQYFFQALSNSPPFVLNDYKNAEDEKETWAEHMGDFRGVVAEQMGYQNLLRVIREDELSVKSVSWAKLDGTDGLRISGDLNRQWGPSKLTTFWVVVDPSFHWAVRAYEMYNSEGGKDTGTITYNPTITDFAYPTRIVEEGFYRQGYPASRKLIDFEDPRPSHAVANDFTLESVGLERPLSKVERRSRNIVLMMLINGGCFVALIVWFVLYRRAKQRRRTAGPPTATG
jgi:hypothetical protein